MKYRGDFIFHLPFRVPLKDCNPILLQVKRPTISALVGLIDEEQAKEYVAPVIPGEVPGHSTTPILKPQNYIAGIAVSIIEEMPTAKDAASKGNIARLQGLALEIANRFLSWVRILDKNIHIRPIPFIDKPDDLGIRMLLWPWHISVINMTNNECLDPRLCKGFGEITGISIRKKGTELPLEGLVKTINDPPDPVRLMFVDALEERQESRYRKFILDAATCVEMGILKKLSKVVKDKEVLKEVNRSFDQKFVNKYFHVIPTLCGMPSLKTQDRDLYNTIDTLFEIRNKVIHEGLSDFDHDKLDRIASHLGRIVDWCLIEPGGRA